MTNNLNQFGALGTQFTYYGLRLTTNSAYVAGTSGTLANGEGSGMGRLLKNSSFTVTIPEAPTVSSQGDNGLANSFMTNPTEAPSGGMAFATFDQDFDTKAVNQVIYAEGPHDIAVDTVECMDFAQMVIVVNSPAKSNESATYGEAGYQVEEYWNVQVQPLSVASKTTNTAHEYTHKMLLNHIATTPYGEAVSTNYGVTRAYKTKPYWSKYPVSYHTYIGDGSSSQTETLDVTPVSADATGLQAWNNGTKLAYTTSYTVVPATRVVTFETTNPGAGEVVVFKIMHTVTC